MRRAKQCFEVDALAVRRDREEREDPAAVVVEHDDRGPQPVAARLQQAAEVVQEGEVAGEQTQRPLRDGRRAECTRCHAVDPARAAVREHAQRPVRDRPERVDVADRVESLDSAETLRVQEFRARVALLIATIRRHEAEENEIIMEAYWDELGAAD